jgi:hypothetical protein
VAVALLAQMLAQQLPGFGIEQTFARVHSSRGRGRIQAGDGYF